MNIYVYIYIYIYSILNTLSGGKSCLVAPGVAVSSWTTETVLSLWLAADDGRVSHVLSHVVWGKKIQENNFCRCFWWIKLILKPINSTHTWDLNRYHHSGSEKTWKKWQRRGTLFIIRYSLVSYPGHLFFAGASSYPSAVDTIIVFKVFSCWVVLIFKVATYSVAL